MQPEKTFSFSQEDLRRRRFRGRSLPQAHFSHCDLRGCDFSRADLRGAKFEHCRVGTAHRWAIALLLMLPLALLHFQAVSTLIFASLGTVPGQPAWAYVQVLSSTLAIATLGAGLQTLSWPVARLARAITGIAVAALMGFFYVGSWADNRAAFAIGGAIALGLLGGWLTWRLVTPWCDATLGLLGAIAAYGYTFWTWAEASSLLTTGHWLKGSGWGAIALVAVGLTLRSLMFSGRSLHRGSTTSFRQANLTGCAFVQTDVTRCDLTDATRNSPS